MSTIESTNNADIDDFFNYLENEGLIFSTKTVENFLLSLKTKQFVIFSGDSGTGKTKLAQAYGRFISSGKESVRKAQIDVTLNKADTNGGFTISAGKFFEMLPYDANKASGEYDITIGDLNTRCTIELTPRLWYRPNKESVVGEIKKLQEQGLEKTQLTINIPSKTDNKKQYEVIAVGSNWTENRFVIGYKNILTGKYSSTKCLDLIVQSNEDESCPYLLILDEMNLSHVERYFSDILSSMESGEEIMLDSEGTDITTSIHVGNNLFIIGTVNVDETTYVFSPKVLDRANVIEFCTTSPKEYINHSTQQYSPCGNIRYLQDCMAGTNVRNMNAIEISEKIGNKEIISKITEDLELIQKYMDSMGLSFGFRTIDEIFRFMFVSWEYVGKGNFESWKRFFDAQIKQKILPKIHGNLSIRSDLEAIQEICELNGYAESSNKLKKMISILEKQRYVSFNC